MSTNVMSILEDIQSGLAYDQESAKLDFSVQLHDLMERSDITQRALAEATGKSEAYISKALRGDANLTIETMVALVRGAAGKLHFKVTGNGSVAFLAEVFEGGKKRCWPADRTGFDWQEIIVPGKPESRRQVSGLMERKDATAA